MSELEVQELQEEVAVNGREKLSLKRSASSEQPMSTPSKRRKVQGNVCIAVYMYVHVHTIISIRTCTCTCISTYTCNYQARSPRVVHVVRSPHEIVVN